MRAELYNGDCLDVMARMPAASVDLIVTDPPYLINYKTNHRKDKNHLFCHPIAGDDDRGLVANYIRECFRMLKDDSAAYCFTSWKTADVFKFELEAAGFHVKNAIIWRKNNWTAGDLRGAFGNSYEVLFFAHKGRALIRGKRFPDVWEFPRVSGNAQRHQNQKPVALLARCIETASDPGAVVFDGMMGSGSTGVACAETGRDFVGVELAAGYYDIAAERLRAAGADVVQMTKGADDDEREII